MESLTTILSSSMRLTAPLAFAGCGEQVAERSGTLNISIEAMMLAGAFFGILGTSVFGSVAAGLLLGMIAGLLVSAVHVNFSHRLTANTFVVGLTLNVLLLGMTSFLLETIEMEPKQAGIVDSTSEALRLIAQRGLKIDGDVVADKSLVVASGTTVVVQAGKRRFARVTVK